MWNYYNKWINATDIKGNRKEILSYLIQTYKIFKTCYYDKHHKKPPIEIFLQSE